MHCAAPYLAILLAASLPDGAQSDPPAAAESVESIGQWRLASAVDRMTDGAASLFRHQDWVERSANGIGLALEIVDRNGPLVPPVTALGLTLDTASRGLLALNGTAQLRLPLSRLFEMPCGLIARPIICTPKASDDPRTEAELLTADKALVRVVGAGAGPSTTEPTELRLTATRDAGAGEARPTPEAPEDVGGKPGEWLQRLLRLFGT